MTKNPFITLGGSRTFNDEETPTKWVKVSEALSVVGKSFNVDSIGVRSGNFGEYAYITGNETATGEHYGLNIPSYYLDDMRSMVNNPECNRAILSGSVVVTVGVKRTKAGKVYPMYDFKIVK